MVSLWANIENLKPQNQLKQLMFLHELKSGFTLLFTFAFSSVRTFNASDISWNNSTRRNLIFLASEHTD